MLSNFSHNEFISATETNDITPNDHINTEFVPIHSVTMTHSNATGLSQRLNRSTSNTSQATNYQNISGENTPNHLPVSPTHHTPAELSYIHHVNSMNNLSYSASAGSINYSAINTTTSAKKKVEAWTEDYSALFPPDSALVSNDVRNGSNLEDSYNSSNSQINIVNALNYTGIEVSQDERNLSNTSIPMDYATSPHMNRPQHHSVGNNNMDSVSRVRTVGQSTFDPVASASDALNTAMLRSTNTINTINTSHSVARTLDSEVLNRAMLNTNNGSLSNSTYSLGPAVLMTGHPQLLRNISDNMSTQSFNLSAIAPLANTTSSFDMENMDQFNPDTMYSRSSSRMNNLSRGAVGASADSNITSNTYNTYNTMNTSGNVLDRAMIASYDGDEVLSEIRLCRTFGSGVSDSTMSVSPFLLSHPGFERSASDYNSTPGNTLSNVITPVATSVGGIGLRTTFFPPPAPALDTVEDASLNDVSGDAAGENSNTYPVSDSHEFNNSMDKIFGATESRTMQEVNISGPDSHSNPLNNFSVNHSGDHSILHSVLNSVEWNVQQSLESLPPPPPPMEPYPAHPLYTTNTVLSEGSDRLVLDTSHTSNTSDGDVLLTMNSNQTGRFDSENDSVLQDTCDFERMESSNSDQNGSGDNSGSDHQDMQEVCSTIVPAEHPVDITNNSDSSHSASIHPTALDTSVDLTASNSNVHLRAFHLPAPVINTTQNVQSYLDFEKDEPAGVVDTVASEMSQLPPVLSPDSASLKQQLLQESMRQFSAIHTLTGDNTYPYIETTFNDGPNMLGSVERNIRGSYGMSALAGLPSLGSMRSLSYIVSSNEGSPRYKNHHDQSSDSEVEDAVSVDDFDERVKDSSVGEGYSDSDKELEEINENYDEYHHAHLGGNDRENVNVDLSMQSGMSHLTHSVNESVNDSISGSIHLSLNIGMNDSVSLSVAHSVGNSITSCNYTSSVEELRNCNPKMRSESWVKEQYPKEIQNTTNTHTTPQKHNVRSVPQCALNESEAPMKTPMGRFRTIPTGFSAPSADSMHNEQGYKDASYYTNTSMVAVAVSILCCSLFIVHCSLFCVVIHQLVCSVYRAVFMRCFVCGCP